MPLNYGVLKGTVAGHLRDADDDHYQILVHAGSQVHRIASNVKSSAPNAPSIVLFQTRISVPQAFAKDLRTLKVGFTRLAPKPDTLAIDYVRGELVTVKAMKSVPPDTPGADNDLKDLLEGAVMKAMDQEGTVIYAFGAKWGPEKGKPDKYFKFVPGNGIHDIHMNQGNSGSYKKDNGVFQDGALIIEYPNDKWRAFFFAFQSQSFDTDDAGNPKVEQRKPSGEGAKKKKPSGKTKRAANPKAGKRRKRSKKPA